MDTLLSDQWAMISITIDAMSVYQKIGASIFLCMVITFFLWVFYLIVSK